MPINGDNFFFYTIYVHITRQFFLYKQAQKFSRGAPLDYGVIDF